MTNTAPDADELAIHALLCRTVAPTRVTPADTRTPPPADADELRIRAYLHRMGVVL